jgi:hypothetical protein
MAKRFTDNEKWKKSFFKGLSTVHKLFFLYIHDDCNHAGVWEVEMDVAQLRIGEQLNETEILQQFNGYVYVFSNGERWFMPAFVKFQYGTLNPKVNAHKSVINILKQSNLVNVYEQFIKGSLTLKDKDKDKDKVKAKDKDIPAVGILNTSPEQSSITFTADQVNNEFFKQGLTDQDAEKFFNHYKSQGWLKGNGLPILELAAQVTNWRLNPKQYEVKEDDKQSEVRKAMQYVADRDSREGKGIMAEVKRSGIVIANEDLF